MSIESIPASMRSITTDRLEMRDGTNTITEMCKLKQVVQEIQHKRISQTDASNITLNNECVIEEIDSNSPHLFNFLMVGDKILKINGQETGTRFNASQMLANACKLEISRRAFASPPPEKRWKALMLPRVDGYAYQLITCKKEKKDMTTATFGFKASRINGFFTVTNINSNTPAERFLAIGDAFLEVDGTAVGDAGTPVNSLIENFNKKGITTCIIMRGVSFKARKEQETRVRKYTADEAARYIDFPMGSDAAKIGIDAAYFHQTIARKLVPRSILVERNTDPKIRKPSLVRSRPSKEEKTSKTTEEEPSDGSGPRARVAVDTNDIRIGIGSDVAPMTELQPIEQRFDEEGDEESDKKVQKGGGGSASKRMELTTSTTTSSSKSKTKSGSKMETTSSQQQSPAKKEKKKGNLLFRYFKRGGGAR